MKLIFCALILSAIASAACNETVRDKSVHGAEKSTDSSYQWTELTKSAAFPKGYNFQIFSIRDTLWAMHHEGAWYSIDGKMWSRSPLNNILGSNAFLDYVWFKDAVYALGSFSGNAERFEFSSTINKTTDMRHWQKIAETSNLPKRFFCHPFVFAEKIWIVGGNGGGDNFDGSDTYSDIWNSIDGIHWIKQAEALPFGKRQSSQIVIFKDKIFMLDNDVWSSSDGIDWSKVSDTIIKGNIFGYAAVVYDGKIWLLGCNRDGIFQSQVLYSDDGITWQSSAAPWTPRGAAAACLFKGKIIFTGGKYGGMSENGRTTEFVYSNDVWALSSVIKQTSIGLNRAH